MRRAPRPWWRSLAEGAVMLLLLAAITFFARQAGWLPDETGSFVAVDGDSLRKDGKDYRLHAIDAPELFQTCWKADDSEYNCGRAARDELRRLIGNATVTCQVLDTDRYGRSVSECRAGSVNLNEAMVRAGWAIAYTRHGQDHAAAQEEARAAKRGIWQGRFQTPEAFRNANRHGLMQQGADD
ncbi:thermonuclease family protein [Aestuariivirga sp.]|uniref:thermonuclease family protein n=1 Tax=Aestuariivirga sp. TaxID=2650926 RepID=UPI003017B7B9